MIFNSTKGTSVAGALRYVEGPGRDPEAKERATLLGGDGFGFDPHDERTAEIAKRLMVQNGSKEFQGEKDKYCTKDCLHLSLSWDPDQAPPDVAEKRETARKFLKALGMENAMHLVYEHNDKRHPHIHIVASRVDPETGRAYDDYKRVEKGLQCALEKERADEMAGRRPIPEAKKQYHQERAALAAPVLAQEPEPDLEARREAAVRGLYKAHREEVRADYLAFKSDERAISGLYKAHQREKERKMTVDDGVAGRWAPTKEQKRTKANDNDKWMQPLIDVWQRNREAVKPRDVEPKRVESMEPKPVVEPRRSIVDRIIERAPMMEKTKEIGREREL